MWRNDNTHVNSNGMCGLCLGEIYNLILDARFVTLRGGGGFATTCVCEYMSVCLCRWMRYSLAEKVNNFAFS